MLFALILGVIASAPAWAQTVAGGLSHTVILKSDGTVWTVGYNGMGQLGDGTWNSRTTPVPVSGLSGVVAVAAGNYHSMAITSTGALYLWGHNWHGQLGDGSTTARNTPVESNLVNVVAIAAGADHAVALKSNGEIYTWGLNASGQLGDGSTTSSASPVLVATAGAAVGAGLNHTLFVKTNGTVYASGANSRGQLGDGTSTPRTAPVQMSGISTATAAVAGEYHSIVLLSDGTMKATGDNGWGELGDGTTTNRLSPVSVASLTAVTAIAGGKWHTLALKSDGTVGAWGRNFSGQLGDGTGSPRTSPTLTAISKIGAGVTHSVAVSATGVVFTWGQNESSQLGDGTAVIRSTPAAISDAGYAWKVPRPTLSVASGTYSTNLSVTINLTTAGATIYYTQNGSEPTELDTSLASGSTVTVSDSRTLKAKAFKSGMAPSHTTAAVYEMKVAAIGYSPGPTTYTTAPSVTMTTATPGATIRYTTDGSTPTASSTAYTAPVSVPTSTVLKAVGFKTDWSESTVASGTYTMNFGTLAAPTADQATGTYTNSVTVALSSVSGATIRYTTNGTAVQSTSPLYTTPLAFDVTTTLKAKAYHPDYLPSGELSRTYTIDTAAPTVDPTTGTYAAGQVITVTAPGVGSTLRYTITGVDPGTSDPMVTSGGTLVAGHYTLKVKAWKTGANPSAVTSATYTVTGDVAPPAVEAGDSHALAIRNDGTVWAWGRNALGELGNGTTTGPQLFAGMVAGTTGALAASGGNGSSHVRLTGGAVAGFGWYVGDGTGDVRAWPITVTALNGVVSVDDGHNFGLALKADGTVLSWGVNTSGQLGDGTTAAHLSPAAVSALTAVAGVSAGRDHALAVKQNGTVYAWGHNGLGRLGDGTTTTRTVPVAVSNITTATTVAAGGLHSLARLADGTLQAWGYNYGGQLGDGTNTDRVTPVAVALLEDVVAIAAGLDFSVALTNDGTVWTWGTNTDGQLGDGTTINRSSPAPVSGLSGITRIAAGTAFVIALDADGRVWTWGRNDHGQLGDGTTTTRSTPFQIAGEGMNWRVVTPAISVASGLYFAGQSATVTVGDSGATLRYTTTGVDPTASDASVTSGGSIAIEQSQTLKVSAWKTGAPTSIVVSRTYELKGATPTLSPGAGSYGGAQSVSIATATSGATLRYTLDGREPTTASPVYSTALTVAETLTVKARAYKTGWTDSDSHHASFSISGGTVATPTVSPAGGAHTAAPLVSMSTATSGATVRFTLDGSTPTAASATFAYPFLVPATSTVKVKAFKAGYTASATTTVTYDVDAAGATATPAMVPGGGWYAVGQAVTMTGPSGATLRYTTDGSDPTTSSTSITPGGTLSVATSQVVKVRAWASGLTESAVRRADFVITGAVAAGTSHSLALAADGTVWAFGADSFGQLGNGASGNSLTPTAVLTGAIAIAAGDRHSLAVTADGAVWGWGEGGSGRLGNGSGTTTPFHAPAAIASFTNAIAVAAGYQHSLALKSDGSVWAFGSNAYGQLGDGTTSSRTVPVQVIGLTGIVAIAVGRDASYALQNDGAAGGLVWAWGSNTSGQLGDGSTLSRSTPTRVTGLPSATRIASSAAAPFAVAMGVDGRVYGWGKNDKAQLGIGVTGDQRSAVPVPVITAGRLVAAGAEYALAVDATARTWAWGDASTSALGVGAAALYQLAAVPQRSDLGGVLQIAAGTTHTLAVMPNGTLRGFGQNGYGVLGTGTTTSASETASVSSLTLADNTWLAGDADRDDLVTWREYLLGTDPLNPDSNGNGFLDGHDDASGASAADPDSDGDGVPNWTERSNGTDPFRADTDGDSVSDLNDAFPLDPARSLAPSANPSDTTPPMVTLKAPVSARLIP